jgi:hypothetical protein
MSVAESRFALRASVACAGTIYGTSLWRGATASCLGR